MSDDRVFPNFQSLSKDVLRLILEHTSNAESALQLRATNRWFCQFITYECNVFWFKCFMINMVEAFYKRASTLRPQSFVPSLIAFFEHDTRYSKGKFPLCDHQKCMVVRDNPKDVCDFHEMSYLDCFVPKKEQKAFYTLVEKHPLFETWSKEALAIYKFPLNEPKCQVFIRAYTTDQYLIGVAPSVCFTTHLRHWRLVRHFPELSLKTMKFFSPGKNYFALYIAKHGFNQPHFLFNQPHFLFKDKCAILKEEITNASIEALELQQAKKMAKKRAAFEHEMSRQAECDAEIIKTLRERQAKLDFCRRHQLEKCSSCVFNETTL